MGRIRTIKPEFWTDEKVVQLSSFARLLFIGLWNLCDDEGCVWLEPLRFKMQLFPMDNIRVVELLKELYDMGMISIYETGDKKNYVFLDNFLSHQRINRPMKSKIKTENSVKTHGGLSEYSVSDHCGFTEDTRRNGKEGKGKERKGNGKGREGTSKLTNVNLLSSCHSTSHIFDENCDETRQLKQDATQVLEFLNRKTGRFFRTTDANLKPIIARMKSGISLQDLKSIIAKKYREWHADEVMSKYLRPATLFNREKCEQYYGELQFETAKEGAENEEVSRV